MGERTRVGKACQHRHVYHYRDVDRPQPISALDVEPLLPPPGSRMQGLTPTFTIFDEVAEWNLDEP
jgi:hypothetical protein